MTSKDSISRLTGRAAAAAAVAAQAETRLKNEALRAMARLLEKHAAAIVAANQADIEAAREAGTTGSMLARLSFDEPKIRGRIASLQKIIALPDPVGRAFNARKTENGLQASMVRVPLGVILMIYEARPHVTINAGAFALKAGNAIICKGGSEAARCNRLLGQLWAEALDTGGLPPETVQIVSLSHGEVDRLLQEKERIALVIPRGGKSLIASVAARSAIPVIKHFEGICHVYVDRDADLERARRIVLDSKLLMPAVCNAAETVLVDRARADWLPELVRTLTAHGVTVRGCPVTRQAAPGVEPGGEDDWRTEHLDLVYSLRVVDGPDGAAGHIRQYGSGHTETIVTENYTRARRFVSLVDSAVVLVNASTMFCDGETLGMGAEIGISTDRLHARGPMGLEELTTYKHVILGDGQVMGQDWDRPAGRQGKGTP